MYPSSSPPRVAAASCGVRTASRAPSRRAAASASTGSRRNRPMGESAEKKQLPGPQPARAPQGWPCLPAGERRGLQGRGQLGPVQQEWGGWAAHHGQAGETRLSAAPQSSATTHQPAQCGAPRLHHHAPAMQQQPAARPAARLAPPGGRSTPCAQRRQRRPTHAAAPSTAATAPPRQPYSVLYKRPSSQPSAVGRRQAAQGCPASRTGCERACCPGRRRQTGRAVADGSGPGQTGKWWAA